MGKTRTRVGDLKAWLDGYDDDVIVLTSDDGVMVVADRYDYSGGMFEHFPVNSEPITDADK